MRYAFDNKPTISSRRVTSQIVTALLLTFTTTNFAPAARFIPLGFSIPQNIHIAEVTVAEDGSVVVGTGSGGNPYDLYRWTPSSGTELLLEDASCIVCLSGDGSTIAATRDLSPQESEPLKITESGIEVLPFSTDYRAGQARAISQDGKTIVGTQRNGFPEFTSEVIRWTQEGVSAIPGLESANSISANGDTVLSGDLGRWTEQGGVQFLPVPSAFTVANSFGLSSDGRWAVGRLRQSGGGSNNWAVRWDQLDAPERLLPANENWGAAALDITADGKIVVGSLYPTDEDTTWQAGVWMEHTGMISLQELLVSDYELGDELAGWQLRSVYDVTDDGRFMVGPAINPAGSREAFLIDLSPIPEPTTAALVLLALVPVAGWRIRHGGQTLAALVLALITTNLATAAEFIPLGTLPTHESSNAYGVSDDGNVVAGFSSSRTDYARAFRWTDQEGMVSLGTLGSDTTSYAGSLGLHPMSADGTVIVGVSSTQESPSGGSRGREAFRFVEGRGCIVR